MKFENKFVYLPKTSKEAKEKGLKFYYTGNPCKRLHFTVRWTGNHNCYECLKILVRVKKKQRWHSRKHDPAYKESIYVHNRAWNHRNKPYYAKYQSSYRRVVKQQTPSWADEELMLDMYIEADYFQQEVDHIVPIKGKVYGVHLVCGLNWEGNYQLLSRYDNRSKHCRHWPDMWNYTKEDLTELPINVQT